MLHLRYAYAKLGTDFYLGGVSASYKAGKAVPPPSYVFWDATRRCNLRCLHCGAVKERYTTELTSEQVKSVLDQLAELKVDMFGATGGEPLLRKDLPEILGHAHGLGIKTGFATNGFFLDEAAAEWIGHAKVTSIQISLDGPEATHNLIRGNEESFARAVRAIGLLQRAGTPIVSVSTTVTRNNVDRLEELRQVLLAAGVRLWRLAALMPIGRAQASDACLTGEQLSRLFDYVRKNHSRGLSIYFAENLTFLGPWERRLRRQPLICPIGFTACCVGVDGWVRGCPEQPDTEENREGSVLETPFRDIWQNGFRRYREREILRVDAKCASCKSSNDCFGGCWVMREGEQHCIYEMLGRGAL
jgi:radical SAM protein with 4Fe4S-binding SPASM domain